MMLFILLSVILAVGVLVLVLYPLLRRQHTDTGEDPALASFRSRHAELQQEHADGLLSDAELREAIDELERELLQSRASSASVRPSDATQRSAHPVALAIVLAIALPAGAGLLYVLTGAPAMLAGNGGDNLSRERIEQLRSLSPRERIETLEDWLDRNPGSVRGWSLLGQAYRESEAYADAANAFARARNAGSEDAWLIARQAEALLLANDRRFTRSVRRLLDEALERDARNGLALMLSGQAALVAGDPEGALDYWQRLVDILPEESEHRALIEQLIAEVKQGIEADADPAGRRENSGDTRLAVRISLSDSLSGDVRPGDTVFVFASAADEEGPPLAVTRTSVQDLPARIVLDDSQAMTPQARLSDADEVTITARVSRSGEAMPRSGDLEGRSEPVAVSNGDAVEVVIDRRLP